MSNDEGTLYVADNPHYYCKTCGKDFYTSQGLNKHILEKHPELITDLIKIEEVKI